MTFTLILFIWRKPGLTPLEFKNAYESYMDILLHYAGGLQPETYTRFYLERRDDYRPPATTDQYHLNRPTFNGSDAHELNSRVNGANGYHAVISTDGTRPPIDPYDVSNLRYPVIGLRGLQRDFDYDCFAELTFNNAACRLDFLQVSEFPVIRQQEVAFMDRAKMKAVFVDDIVISTRVFPPSTPSDQRAQSPQPSRSIVNGQNPDAPSPPDEAQSQSASTTGNQVHIAEAAMQLIDVSADD